MIPVRGISNVSTRGCHTLANPASDVHCDMQAVLDQFLDAIHLIFTRYLSKVRFLFRHASCNRQYLTMEFKHQSLKVLVLLLLESYMRMNVILEPVLNCRSELLKEGNRLYSYHLSRVQSHPPNYTTYYLTLSEPESNATRSSGRREQGI